MSGSTNRKNALLREKLASGSQIIGPGVYDGLSARIADASGFDVLYLSGYGVSASLNWLQNRRRWHAIGCEDSR